MAGDDAAIVADDLSIEYPGSRERFAAIRGITLRVAPGELVGLVGETGSGKSTLARTIAGRTARRGSESAPRVVGGSLSVLGADVRTMGERTRRRLTAGVGYLPQNAGRTLRQDITVAENVAEPIFERDRHFDRRDAGVRAAELIDAVQLPLGMMARYPHELSNGQRQRVAIARSLVLGPRLWVADEPTAGVDVTVRGPVLDTLLDLQSDQAFTAVIISHDAAVMTQMTDRVAVLHRGVLVGLGPVQEVLARPQHPYVQGLADDYELRTGPVRVVERSGMAAERGSTA